MKRNEAIARINATLPRLSDERVQALAEIVQTWADETIPSEDDATRAAIARGLAQAERGEFATDEEVEGAYKRFRM